MRSRIANTLSITQPRARWLMLAALTAILLVLAAGIFISPSAEAVAQDQPMPLAPGVDMGITSLTRAPLSASYNLNTDFNIVITVQNVGIGDADLAAVTLDNQIDIRNLTFIGFVSSTPNGLFTCGALGTAFVRCQNTNGAITPGTTEVITYTVRAAALGNDIRNAATISTPLDTNLANDYAEDASLFSIVGPTATFSVTPTFTATFTATASLTPLPSLTPIPTITSTFTATFIPPPLTRTPLPRPANAGLAIPIPPSGVDMVVNRDNVNVRLVPAIGAEVIGFVNSGWLFEDVQARSADSEWVRVNLAGQQGWVGVPVLTLLAGDINALPIADPRTIPYGGFENPRAGLTSVTSGLTVRLRDSGMRLRAGPSIGYPVLANAPRYTIMPVLGRLADNTWLQVNFEGTLGWIKLEDVLEFNSPDVFTVPPVDGIVADALPFSDNTFDSYVDTLRLLLARLDIAKTSLDEIRTIWTNIGLGGQAQCGDFPAQPSDYHIPTPLLATFNPTLGPISQDFNIMMAGIRDAIRLLIQACSFPQPAEGSIGAGAVSVALETINNADAIYPGLRQRIVELLPPDRPVGLNECLFTFGNRSQIIPRLLNLTPVVMRMDSNERVLGFCFDGTAGQQFRVEGLRVSGNITPQFSISSFNDPTNFIATGRLPLETNYVAVNNILIPETGQYVLIISDTSTPLDGDLEGDLAVMLTDLTMFGGQAGIGIALDANGNVITNPNIGQVVVTAVPIGTPSGLIACPSVLFTCSQLLTCQEAQACLAAGNTSLDPDSDGLPCEENLCFGGT